MEHWSMGVKYITPLQHCVFVLSVISSECEKSFSSAAIFEEIS